MRSHTDTNHKQNYENIHVVDSIHTKLNICLSAATNNTTYTAPLKIEIGQFSPFLCESDKFHHFSVFYVFFSRLLFNSRSMNISCIIDSRCLAYAVFRLFSLFAVCRSFHPQFLFLAHKVARISLLTWSIFSFLLLMVGCNVAKNTDSIVLKHRRCSAGFYPPYQIRQWCIRWDGELENRFSLGSNQANFALPFTEMTGKLNIGTADDFNRIVLKIHITFTPIPLRLLRFLYTFSPFVISNRLSHCTNGIPG